MEAKPPCVWEGRVLDAWSLHPGAPPWEQGEQSKALFETLPSLNPEKCAVTPFFFSLTGPFLPCFSTNSAAQAAAADPASSRSRDGVLSSAF